MQQARTAKHYTIANLARGTNILPKSLWKIEKNKIAALPEQLAKIELYLGVPLVKTFRSKIEKAI